MIQKTVYFRDQDDLDKFNSLKNKAEWLHEHLNGLELKTLKPIKLTGSLHTPTTFPKQVVEYYDEPTVTDPEDVA